MAELYVTKKWRGQWTRNDTLLSSVQQTVHEAHKLFFDSLQLLIFEVIGASIQTTAGEEL